MRIFVALKLPGSVRRKIADWKEPLTARYPALKWVRGDQMHLTLRFFGNIPEAGIKSINDILSSWNPGPLSFSIDSIGSFGNVRSPSVFWLGGNFPHEVFEMALELGRVPDEKGRTGEKGFVPHLTVARRKGFSELPKLEPPPEIKGVLAEVAVIDSRLTSVGPEYTFIERYSLH